MDIGVYYSNMFLFQKTLGLSAKVNFNFPLRNQEMLYDNNYSFLLGTLFRINTVSEWRKATFLIDTGVENQFYKTNPWREVIVKASLAIPFSIFEKPKEEKKS